MSDPHTETSANAGSHPEIVGDVVFGGIESPVAVCTLGSRSLLPELAGRPEIAVAGRVFTENVGVERMIQNLAAFDSIRFLIVCGRETRHLVGETILALHRYGMDEERRVVGSTAPEPFVPNLTPEQLAAFQTRVTVVDMVGAVDASAIVERAATLVAADGLVAPGASEMAPEGVPATPVDALTSSADSDQSAGTALTVETVAATRDAAAAWQYDPVGYFLVFVDRARQLLRAEHRTSAHVLVTVFEGKSADDLCHTIVRRGAVTLLAHAAYLGRELARAETALAMGLEYEQDRPLASSARPNPTT